MRDIRHVRLPAAALCCWPQALTQVQRLEQEGVTAVLLPIAAGGFEPLTLAAGLAAQTQRIGLVIGIQPAVTPPYTAARRLAALDHASAGRIGWFLDQSTDALRAADYAAAVRALWDSWDEGLHRIDRDGGCYIDTTGIRAADYCGPYYRSAGPLDVPRPPQGHPVFYAAQVALGVDMLLSDEPVRSLRGNRAGEPAPNQVRDRAGQPVPGPSGNYAAAPTCLRAQLGLPLPAPPAHAHANARVHGTRR